MQQNYNADSKRVMFVIYHLRAGRLNNKWIGHAVLKSKTGNLALFNYLSWQERWTYYSQHMGEDYELYIR